MPKSRPTIRDVANLAEVATGTVSRVVNGHSNVAAEIQDRVRHAIAQLGYRPSSAARSMRTRATRLIACLLPDIRNPLYADVLSAAETVLSEAGYTLIVAGTAEDPERELQLIDTFARHRVDGVIAVPTHEKRRDLHAAYRALHTPIVMLERNMPIPLVGTVATDQARSVHAATSLLLDLGHRRIALLTSPVHNRSGRERANGFRAAFADRGLRPDETLIHDDALPASATEAALHTMLRQKNGVTAVITAGDRSLGGALRAIRATGRRIPQDISVIAWGDGDLAQLATPAVTAIRYDAIESGREAARLLLSALGNDVPPSRTRRVLLPAELVIRESCAAPP